MAEYLTTVSHQSVDNDVQRILDGSTGVFYDDFNKKSEGFQARPSAMPNRSVQAR